PRNPGRSALCARRPVVLAQPSKLIVWLAMRERRCGQQVDFWFSHRGFYLSALDRTIGRSSEGGNATVRARRVLQKGLAPEVPPLGPTNKCSMRFAETGGSTASGRSPLFRSLEYQVGLYNRSLKSRKQRQIASTWILLDHCNAPWNGAR